MPTEETDFMMPSLEAKKPASSKLKELNPMKTLNDPFIGGLNEIGQVKRPRIPH